MFDVDLGTKADDGNDVAVEVRLMEENGCRTKWLRRLGRVVDTFFFYGMSLRKDELLERPPGSPCSDIGGVHVSLWFKKWSSLGAQMTRFIDSGDRYEPSIFHSICNYL